MVTGVKLNKCWITGLSGIIETVLAISRSEFWIMNSVTRCNIGLSGILDAVLAALISLEVTVSALCDTKLSIEASKMLRIVESVCKLPEASRFFCDSEIWPHFS